MNYSKLKMPFVLWSAVTLFFSFQFILRLFPGILREEIMDKFSIDIVSFGTLSGYYYLGYAGMQIPFGFMLDRFNTRFITFLAITIASIGTLAFSISPVWEIVLLGRVLIGAGCGVAFLSVAKVTKTYFPEKMHGMLIGFSFTFGLIGAVIGGKPAKIIFDNYGYDPTFFALSIIGIVIAFIILFISDNKIEKIEYKEDTQATLFDALKLIFNPAILLIGISGGLMVGSLEGFTDVWGIMFFEQIYGYSHLDSIFATSVVFIGMCFGGPILAWFAEKTGSTTRIIVTTGLFTILLFVFMFYVNTIDYYLTLALMFFLGILCCYQVLVFNMTSSLVEKKMSGLAIAVINCINMSFGHLFHKSISGLVDKAWNGALNVNNMPFYDKATQVYALSIIPVLCLLGTLGFIYINILQTKKILNNINDLGLDKFARYIVSKIGKKAKI
jgi:MFS family permease